MDVLTKIQVNISVWNALEQIFVYAKFMNKLLSGNCKLKHDENIALTEECSAII